MDAHQLKVAPIKLLPTLRLATIRVLISHVILLLTFEYYIKTNGAVISHIIHSSVIFHRDIRANITCEMSTLTLTTLHFIGLQEYRTEF